MEGRVRSVGGLTAFATAPEKLRDKNANDEGPEERLTEQRPEQDDGHSPEPKEKGQSPEQDEGQSPEPKAQEAEIENRNRKRKTTKKKIRLLQIGTAHE